MSLFDRTFIKSIVTFTAVSVAWVVLYSSFTPSAQALSCVQPGSPTDELTEADLVVYGNISVLEMDAVGQTDSIPPTEILSPVGVEITVNQVFKGEVGDTFYLDLGAYTTWFTEPQVGDFVLLYLSKDSKGQYQMPLCGRSVIGDGASDERLLLDKADNEEVELTECHRKGTNSSRVPGFGLPYDPDTKEMTMTAKCSQDEVNITVNSSGNELVYTYQHGYIFYDNKWEPYNYKLGDGAQKKGSWLIGPAVHSLASEQVNSGETVYFASYTCKWAGRWKCGCTNSFCLRPTWQLQTVDIPSNQSITNE